MIAPEEDQDGATSNSRKRTATSTEARVAWDREYLRGAKPSTNRVLPSDSVNWLIENLKYLGTPAPCTAVDLGCGAGRNSIRLAEQGIDVLGIDISTVAARQASRTCHAKNASFVQADLGDRFPVADRSFNLVVDVFAYIFQLSDDARNRYRHEIHRILRPGGLLLLSLATADDEYYRSCPPIGDEDHHSSVATVWDPRSELANSLPTGAEYLGEFESLFSLQMCWRKSAPAVIDGTPYARRRDATIWRAM